MRNYLKEKFSKLSRFAKEHKADYIEFADKKYARDFAIWKMPEIKGADRLAVRLYEDGFLQIGTINPICDNFEIESGEIYPEEAIWLSNILPVLAKYGVKK